jgi:N-acylneuraminate cytidylyltransferase/CMP-N,N'-diacetyllegionaminic acid synthase
MIAIIPARGGSKGLPGKNIKEFCGKPMIAYTIEAAKRSKFISDIIISTDDQNVADIAISYGAICPFLRPEALASDEALAIDNYIYTINRLNKECGYEINEFVILQPTSPLRRSEDIDGAIFLFNEKNADSVVSYTMESHPISWHKFLDDDLQFENIFDETLQNRQNNKVSYFPNGAIFVFDYNLIKNKKYYSNKSYGYVMPKNRSVDVDCADDFEYAEYLFRNECAK